MGLRISVIIPNHNGSRTLAPCLEAIFSSCFRNFEVIVVDDCSSDGSVAIIERFPCRLLRLSSRQGAAMARNHGALHAKGKILFFIDADCIVLEDTLSVVDLSMNESDRVVVGGTYTPQPYDNRFFSALQSIFINHFETKNAVPDYIASHAMAIGSGLFSASGGFPEDFLPIIEDVEFSHRLKRSGVLLRMHPGILVSHCFDFSLLKSLRNGFRKSKFWTMYSIKNRDVLKDSGTASLELKANVSACFLLVLLGAAWVLFDKQLFLLLMTVILLLNVYINRELLAAFHRVKGFFFALAAGFYYLFVYPFAVGAGSCAGIAGYHNTMLRSRGIG